MSSAQLAKWWATIRISWNKQLSYKLNFLLLVIGPSVVFFLLNTVFGRQFFASKASVQFKVMT